MGPPISKFCSDLVSPMVNSFGMNRGWKEHTAESVRPNSGRRAPSGRQRYLFLSEKPALSDEKHAPPFPSPCAQAIRSP